MKHLNKITFTLAALALSMGASHAQGKWSGLVKVSEKNRGN